jgi:cytochrome c peroxidase
VNKGSNMKKLLLTLVLTMSAFSADVDQQLKEYIKEFHYTVPKRDKELVRPLFFLGRQLFHARSLSLAGDMTCAHCHHPMRGTGDGLPVSIGTGGDGEILTRTQGQAATTPRHSPALWNRSTKDAEFLFWDGRVGFHKISGRGTFVTTPSKLLTGVNPVLEDVAAEMVNAAAAQAMFPPTSVVEMRGEKYLDLDDGELWEKITENVLNDSTTDMRTMFQLAFPGVEKFNMGHIGKALAHFQEIAFFIDDTPWDKYLAGDINAMNERDKRGALLFIGKAKCSACHHGEKLTSGGFENVMVADVGLGEAPDDKGRYDVTGEELDKYRFLVPNLRNVALTAPYMHNGSMETLEDVVRHYNHPMRTLRHFEPTEMNTKYGKFYNKKFVRNWESVREQFKYRSELLEMNLFLTEQEISDLVYFLEHTLTSKRWSRVNEIIQENRANQ